MPPETSPAIIVLVLAAAAAAGTAFWLSILEGRRFRRLIRWIETQRPERWWALPWFSRHVNLVGAVADLRRQGLSADPAFMSLYAETRRHGRLKLVFTLIGAALIAIIPIGVRIFDWRW